MLPPRRRQPIWLMLAVSNIAAWIERTNARYFLLRFQWESFALASSTRVNIHAEIHCGDQSEFSF